MASQRRWAVFLLVFLGLQQPTSPSQETSGYSALASSFNRLVRLHREAALLESSLASAGVRMSMSTGTDHEHGGTHDAWTVRVVPFGVGDPEAWPFSRPIPSNKVTVFLGVGPGHGPVPADMVVSIIILKSRPSVDDGVDGQEEEGEPKLIHFATSTLQIAPSYDINIGPGAAGTYVLELRAASNHSSSEAPSPLLAMSAFYIEAQQPEEGASGSCLDLPAVSAEATWGAPPANIPPDLCARYTINGTIAVGRDYYDDRSDPDKSYRARSEEEIEKMVVRARQRDTYYYGATDTWLYEALDRYPIKGKRVLLIGSNVPWYEAICLAFEASECVTVDYNELRYHHPRLRTLRPWELQEGAEHVGSYDAIWSISSYEHDGLGRYGDPLNPDADLESMSSVGRYLVREGGMLFLAVPVGRDCVYWNAGRVYGSVRLPMLLDKWHAIESFGFRYSDFDRPTMGEHQPVFVLAPQR